MLLLTVSWLLLLNLATSQFLMPYYIKDIDLHSVVTHLNIMMDTLINIEQKEKIEQKVNRLFSKYLKH